MVRLYCYIFFLLRIIGRYLVYVICWIKVVMIFFVFWKMNFGSYWGFMYCSLLVILLCFLMNNVYIVDKVGFRFILLLFIEKLLKCKKKDN